MAIFLDNHDLQLSLSRHQAEPYKFIIIILLLMIHNSYILQFIPIIVTVHDTNNIISQTLQHKEDITYLIIGGACTRASRRCSRTAFLSLCEICTTVSNDRTRNISINFNLLIKYGKIGENRNEYHSTNAFRQRS